MLQQFFGMFQLGPGDLQLKNICSTGSIALQLAKKGRPKFAYFKTLRADRCNNTSQKKV